MVEMCTDWGPLRGCGARRPTLDGSAAHSRAGDVYSLAVAETIASTHCAYTRSDGQAELAW